jgi:YceI-like domain
MVVVFLVMTSRYHAIDLLISGDPRCLHPAGTEHQQFQDRIMATADFPTATFRLVAPVTLRRLPADLTTVRVSARGRLTLHGKTQPVTVALTTRRNGAHVEVQGSILVAFADYGIPNRNFGPAQTDDRGTIEFLLVFDRVR